jgi:metacaspase-1
MSGQGDFEGQAAELIPADVRMISGCQDAQTSADVSNVSAFSLPDPAGKAGGATTSSLLQVLYHDHHKNDENLSFVQVLTRMKTILSQGQYTQIPQLSASRKMDVNQRFEIVPESSQTGTRRALYVGLGRQWIVGSLASVRVHTSAWVLFSLTHLSQNPHGFVADALD